MRFWYLISQLYLSIVHYTVNIVAYLLLNKYQLKKMFDLLLYYSIKQYAEIQCVYFPMNYLVFSVPFAILLCNKQKQQNTPLQPSMKPVITEKVLHWHVLILQLLKLINITLRQLIVSSDGCAVQYRLKFLLTILSNYHTSILLQEH